jgi:hypothetical protein
MDATKLCKRCDIVKSIEDFRMVNSKKCQYRCSWCRDCEKKRALEKYHDNKEACQKRNKQYKEDHKEEIKEKRKQYLEDNKDYVKERYRDYCQRNREKINQIAKDYNNTNVHAKLRRAFRSRLLECLNNKDKSTREYLGAPFNFVADWLQFRWDDNMSWENYGSYWHVDHVIPITCFNTDDDKDIKICFSWFNLQPLEKRTNIAKHNKLIPWMVEIQFQKIDQFLSQRSDTYVQSCISTTYQQAYQNICTRCATSSNCGNTLRAP